MDYYAVLGVARTATPDEIRKSYRALAFKNHPDRNPGDPQAESRFRDAAIAYEVVGDPTNRSLYDLQGFVGRRPPSDPPRAKPPEAAPKPPEPPKAAPEPEPAEPPKDAPKPEPAEPPKDAPKPSEKKTRDPQPVGHRNPTWDNDWNLPPRGPAQHELDVVPCMFFGPDDAGRNILVHLKCTPEELRSGCRKTVKIKRRKSCSRCAGDRVVFEKCSRCGGRWESIRHEVWGAPERCPVCDCRPGEPKTCPQCGGVGLFPWEIKDIPVAIPPGTRPGFRVVYAEGEDGIGGQPPGRLHVAVI